MKLASLIPDSNLLEQIEGVEAGLRKIQKIGRVGQYGFLFTAILQIVLGAFESGILPALDKYPKTALAINVIRIASLVVLPIFLLLFTWSKFWLRQSREPFRYTCSIEAITALPQSPVLRESAWLANDLEELLSQRIERIRFVKAGAPAPAGSKDESHIEIGGTYVIRPRDDEDKTLVLEIMPSVGIGRGKARKLAYPVSYPPEPTPLNRLRKADNDKGDIYLRHSEYKALLERVYSSVATEIYQQIQTDVAGKIELMPTRFLRAQALFHEAEDYASSNTLHGYSEAARLYNASAHLFDPCLKPLPLSPLRRVVAKLTRWVYFLARRALMRFAPVNLAFARRDIMCARALTGYVNMLLFVRTLATISGQKIDPAFEAQRAAHDALARFDLLPPDAPGCREAKFDAHVSLALAYHYLGKRQDAEKELATARSQEPTRDRDIHFQMARSALAPREKQAFRHLLNLAPRWETVQWSVAYEAERQWRARPAFESSLADIPIREYQNVIELNPGNVGAWANRGYLLWLLGKKDEAKESFRGGRDYKLIKQETFVAELDYGLARIAAEQGELQQAYCYQDTAVSDLIAPTLSFGDFRAYYFDLMGDAVLNRFECYRAKVEEHLADASKTKDLSSRILNSIYAFVLTDYGECCNAHYQRTADARSLEKFEKAFALAYLFDPENPLALYNLRQSKVRDVLLPGQKTEPELKQEIAAAEALIEKLKNEKEFTTAQTSVSSEPRGLVDDQVDALQQKIESAGEYIEQSKQQIAEARNQISEAKHFDEKIAELHPYWTLGMLRKIEMNALEAFIHRRDALQSPGAAADEHLKTATALEKEVTQNISALVPHQWLWTKSSDFNWDAIRQPDPLNERRWERQFNDIHTSALLTYASTLLLSSSDNKNGFLLVDHLFQTFSMEDYRLLRRLQELSKDGSQPTHTDDDQKMRAAIRRWREGDPYSFVNLWSIAENSFTDSERIETFLDAAGRPGLSGPLYQWLGETQLLEIAGRTRDKRELLEPVARTMTQLLNPANTQGLRLVEPSPSGNETHDPKLIDALKRLDEVLLEELKGNGIDKDDIPRLRKHVERILASLEETLSSVRAASAPGVRPADRITWKETLPTRTEQLEGLLTRYRDMENQCVVGAIKALTSAVTSSDDPGTLWNVAALLAKFGHFEPALGATTKAAQIDAQRPEGPVDQKKLDQEIDQAAGRLLGIAPAEYSTQFQEFLKLYRQPPAQSHTKTQYLRRRCALLALLDKVDSDPQAFVELKQSDKRWRAAIATEIGSLAVADHLAGQTTERLVAGRAAFQKWLDTQRAHPAGWEDVVDCRLAQVMLARAEMRAVRDDTEFMPGAKSLKFLPAVTPVAIEYEANLLDGGDTLMLTETLFPNMRKRIREDTGVKVPGVRMRSNDTDLAAGQYLIMVNEIPLVMNTAYAGKVFVRSAQSAPSRSTFYRAEQTRFPPEGDWHESDKERTGVWSHLEYIVRHVEHVIRSNIVQFFGVEETYNMLGEWLDAGLPAEVADHIRATREDHRLLRRTSRQLHELLNERVPLTQAEQVATGLVASHRVADPAESRRILRASLRDQLWGNDDEYVHFKLSDSINAILDRKSSPGERVELSPEDLQEFLSAVRMELGSNGQSPAIVTSGERLRYLVRYLIRQEWNEVPVLAANELAETIPYDKLPEISLE
ncbi:MAG TPA: FHIPEP family type III secretion protein [Pyrinomonadaceae bacterium]|nr:FHIPEP family type III secretion protein [Pyrinomonadaceae bacterium]